MKRINIYKYIAFTLASTALTGCIDMEQYPLDAISPNTYFNTDNDLMLYTNSFYDMLPSAEGVYNEAIDNIVKQDLANELQGGSRRLVPASGGGWSWGNLRNINFYLQNSPKCADEKARNRYDAVAHFFRAYFYFDKVKRFGDVPWYSVTLSDQDWDKMREPRTPRIQVVDSILKEIDKAIEYLPETKTVNEVSKWTALALKSRICLFEGTFRKYHTELNLPDYEMFLEEAANAALEVMNSSGYKIYNTGNPESDYLNLFASVDAIADEVILARSFSDALQVYHNLNYYTMTASYGRPGLEKRLVNSYLMKDGSRFTDIAGYDKMEFHDEMQDRDPRLSQTIRTPGYTRIGSSVRLVPEFGSTVTGYQMIKFVASPDYDTYNKSVTDMPLFRYAEVLLNYAEAKAERGTLTQDDLDKSIQLLRNRAGIDLNLNMAQANADPDPYQAKLYKQVNGANKGVILEIRRERRVELVMESYRWDDIIRWKEGQTLTEQFKGMYFPGPGTYDLDKDGTIDICLYTGNKPDAGKNIQYLKLGSDITLEHGESGNIVVNPHLSKQWNENRDYFYPIPINERSLNHNLAQNPGWDDGLDF